MCIHVSMRMCMCMKTSSMETDVDISLCHTYYKFQTLVIVGDKAKNDSAGMYNNCIHHIAQRVKCRQNQSHGRPLVVSSLAWTDSHQISNHGMEESVSHLCSGVDGGPRLEEYRYHTGVAKVGRYNQRSVPTLWGESKELIYWYTVMTCISMCVKQ